MMPALKIERCEQFYTDTDARSAQAQQHRAFSSHQPPTQERIMYHFATALSASIIATVLVSGIAFVPTPAEAAKLSNAERVALEKATAACKSEAKGMKFSWHWRKRQKYVQNCIIRSASKQGIDIWEVRRAVNMKDLSSQEVDDWSFVFSRSRHR
jgi:hypothetical protein